MTHPPFNSLAADAAIAEYERLTGVRANVQAFYGATRVLKREELRRVAAGELSPLGHPEKKAGEV